MAQVGQVGLFTMVIYIGVLGSQNSTGNCSTTRLFIAATVILLGNTYIGHFKAQYLKTK